MKRSKKFIDDICRIVDHDIEDGVCKRCGKEFGVRIPTFSINVKPAVKFSDINIRRYDIFGRAQQRMSDSLKLAEDSALLKIIQPEA